MNQSGNYGVDISRPRTCTWLDWSDETMEKVYHNPICAGQHLPPGTVVGTNPGAMNKRTDIYGADAGTFDPLRWMRRASETQDEFVERRLRMERAGMTFGYGARSCIGKNIVQLELFKVVATLMRLYQVCLNLR